MKIFVFIGMLYFTGCSIVTSESDLKSTASKDTDSEKNDSVWTHFAH